MRIQRIKSFKKEIAPCRTFCFLHEIEFLYNNNLIKGGDCFDRCDSAGIKNFLGINPLGFKLIKKDIVIQSDYSVVAPDQHSRLTNPVEYQIKKLSRDKSARI